MVSHVLHASDSLRVYDDILGAIGKTPLVHLTRLGRGLPCPLYAKVEFFNPGGSVKDRIAVSMIEQAEQSGRLKPGGTVVEATSGNTGMGLALVCAKKGYKAIFVMPDIMSQKNPIIKGVRRQSGHNPHRGATRGPAFLLQCRQAHRGGNT
jgi:threonine dehydratase